MQLTREKLRTVAISDGTPCRSDRLLQECFGKDPWKVAIASMLLCRTRRPQAESTFFELLRQWPGPEELCRADTRDVANVVRPCGFYNVRARQLTRFSSMWLGDGWNDLRDLPGVGLYVADAVGLVCFGCTDLESSDGALQWLVARIKEAEHGV